MAAIATRVEQRSGSAAVRRNSWIYVIVGIVGSFLGVYVASAFGLRTFGAPADWIVAVLGAALLIWILRALGVFSRLSSAH